MLQETTLCIADRLYLPRAGLFLLQQLPLHKLLSVNRVPQVSGESNWQLEMLQQISDEVINSGSVIQEHMSSPGPAIAIMMGASSFAEMWVSLEMHCFMLVEATRDPIKCCSLNGLRHQILV